MFEYLKIIKSHVTATYQSEYQNLFVTFHTADYVKYLKKNSFLLCFLFGV